MLIQSSVTQTIHGVQVRGFNNPYCFLQNASKDAKTSVYSHRTTPTFVKEYGLPHVRLALAHLLNKSLHEFTNDTAFQLATIASVYRITPMDIMRTSVDLITKAAHL